MDNNLVAIVFFTLIICAAAYGLYQMSRDLTEDDFDESDLYH